MALTTVTYYFDFVFSYVFDSHTSHHGSAHGILIRFWLEVMRSLRADIVRETRDKIEGEATVDTMVPLCAVCCVVRGITSPTTSPDIFFLPAISQHQYTELSVRRRIRL